MLIYLISFFLSLLSTILLSHSLHLLFLHVPLAWLSLLLILLINLFSLLYLLYHRTTFLHYSYSLINLSILFTFLTILTGILWSKPTWGSYIVLDSRLLFMLLLFFISISYKILTPWPYLYSLISSFGFLYVLFVRYSVHLWSSLHQVNSISLTSFSIDKSLILPLLLVFLFFLLLSFYLFSLTLLSSLYSSFINSLTRRI